VNCIAIGGFVELGLLITDLGYSVDHMLILILLHQDHILKVHPLALTF
jgi:hypothetical protein